MSFVKSVNTCNLVILIICIMASSRNTPAPKEIKLPEFTLNDPEFWFDAADEILSAVSASDDEKCNCVKNHLLDVHLKRLLEKLPADLAVGDKYGELRSCVLSRILSEQLESIELVALFTCEELKPSIFLRYLTCVTNDVLPKSIIRIIWLARLPRRIQKILFVSILSDPVAMEDRSLHSLAAAADGIAAYEKYHSLSTLNMKHINNLPSYTGNDPELWFYMLDEAFTANDVTDERLKYEYTVGALSTHDLFIASLFLTDLPNRTTQNQYCHLRERVIKTSDEIQQNETYGLVFRNINNLKPSQFLKFLNNLAAKSGSAITQVVVRTLWIMQLPIEAQAVLFQLMLSSVEPLQDMNMAVMSSVADTVCNTNKKETMKKLVAYLKGPSLVDKDIDEEVFQSELHRACSSQQKIALGKLYCDYMYKVYYDESPFKSVNSCILYNHDYTAKDMFELGCTCWYHEMYKEKAYKCLKLI